MLFLFFWLSEVKPISGNSPRKRSVRGRVLDSMWVAWYNKVGHKSGVINTVLLDLIHGERSTNQSLCLFPSLLLYILARFSHYLKNPLPLWTWLASSIGEEWTSELRNVFHATVNRGTRSVHSVQEVHRSINDLELASFWVQTVICLITRTKQHLITAQNWLGGFKLLNA